MAKPTIHDAITHVLREKKRALTAEEILSVIRAERLYNFKAQDPLSILSTTLRRHCKDRNFSSARAMKYFTQEADGKWALLDTPIRVKPDLFRVQEKGKASAVVSVPSDEDEDDDATTSGPTHYEIQWRLLDLGSQIGLRVWCPLNDRGRSWNNQQLGNVHGILDKLPTQFDGAIHKTIENIDVLWLDREAIIAGFEVEHTSTIYSGLLRMSDLIAMQPNVDIRLYLTAPDERYAKFAREVARPTFSRALRKPLHTLCRFLPYTQLLQRLETAKEFISDLRPEFLNKIAITYDPAAELAKAE